MPENKNEKIAKLTLTLVGENGKTAERVIDGADKIAYILEEAGILDSELEALLGQQ